jgi:hypothetical protein
MKTIGWKREPKGPGPRAQHMFLDAHNERVEILVYDCPPFKGHGRMCGFEIFGRKRRKGPFHKQIAAGEASSVDEAKDAALRMIALPREKWTVLPRSWVDP